MSGRRPTSLGPATEGLAQPQRGGGGRQGGRKGEGMTAERLCGKIVLVTGGASGIGLSTALRSAEHGATVVVADIDLPKAQQGIEGHPALSALQLDVVNEASWERVIDDVLGRFGRLDVLVNSAGIA